MKIKYTDYLYLLPTFLLLFIVSFYPLLRTIQLSLTEYDLTYMKEAKFKGLSNYIMLLKDGDFFSSLYATLIFTSMTVIVEVILGLIMALILNENFLGRSIIRTILILPWECLLL